MRYPGDMIFSRMRWLLATFALLVCLASLTVSCLPSPTVTCANETICSAGQECLVRGSDTFCATPEQIALCVGFPDGAECGEPGDLTRCFNGFCQPSLCGNDVVDASVGEACEPGIAIVAATCAQRGYDNGEIGCDNACTVDTNSCEQYCGDGVVDDDEECDGEDFNEQLAISCAAPVLSFTPIGAVTCTRDCRIDVSECHAEFRADRVVTLPPIPVTANPLAAFVVNENDVWVVEANTVAGGKVSSFAHWTGDRWRRGIIDTLFKKDASCNAIWATRGVAFAGCSNGEIITFQDDSGTSTAVGASGIEITSVWGFSANKVWAAKGSDLYYYNGSVWAPEAGWAARAAGNIISLGGDADDLFALTDIALFHRNTSGTWREAVRQPSPKLYSQMSVVDENHVWLRGAYTNPSAGAAVILYQGLQGPVTDFNVENELNIQSEVTLVADSATSFYLVDQTGSAGLQRYEATRFGSSTPGLRAMAFKKSGDPVDGVQVVAVGGNSAWGFGASLRATIRSTLVETVLLIDSNQNIPLLRVSPLLTPLPVIARGLDGKIYVSVNMGKMHVVTTDASAVETVDVSTLGTIEAFAPVGTPENPKLLIFATPKLAVFNGSLSLTDFADVRGILASGPEGYVINNGDLFQYRDSEFASLAQVAPGNVLMAGGRVNDADIIWVVSTTTNGAVLQRFTIVARVATVATVALPAIPGLVVQKVWSSGPDLWLAGSDPNTMTLYFGRWIDGRWLAYSVPGSIAGSAVSTMWSGRPGQIWLSQDRTLLRFDGSRWSTSDISDLGFSHRIATFSADTNDQLWALVNRPKGASFKDFHLAHLDHPHPPLTGGACPAQQELFCRDSGHGVTEGPRTIATIVGGRFGAAHYVLNSTLSGRIRFEGQLPTGVEAIWALPHPSGTCVGGSPLAFLPNGTSPRAEQTLGPSRYFLTLRSRDPLDKTEYPVALDYSCNRVD